MAALKALSDFDPPPESEDFVFFWKKTDENQLAFCSCSKREEFGIVWNSFRVAI